VVSSPGIYTNIYTNTAGCDSLIVVIKLTILTAKTVNTSVSICAGQTYKLPSGKTVGATGVYNDTVQYAATGCDSLITTTNLTVLTTIKVDTSVTVCAGQTYTLPSGKIENASGIYTDNVKYTGGCDSLVTTLNLIVLSVKRVDTGVTICIGQTYTLPSGKMVNAAGLFGDTLRYTASGCDSLITTATVTVDNPSQNVQELACSDSSKVLTIGPGFTNYIWGNGATTPTITVTQPGLYAVQATDPLGCTAIDTFDITTDVIPTAVAQNVPLCQGTNLVLTTTQVFLSYLWNDGSTLPTLKITSPGLYFVTVTDDNHCQATDSVYVTSVAAPINFLAASITKCFYNSVVIQPNNSYAKYVWSTGDNTQAISVFAAGTYTLQVTDSNGCVATDSISVLDSACAEYMYLPTAFTPNGDGHNDVFRPSFKGVATQYSFMVYNRWGQQVFASNNPANGWDGTVNGNPQAPGVYVWYCQYQLYERPPVSQKGTVVLIR